MTPLGNDTPVCSGNVGQVVDRVAEQPGFPAGERCGGVVQPRGLVHPARITTAPASRQIQPGQLTGCPRSCGTVLRSMAPPAPLKTWLPGSVGAELDGLDQQEEDGQDEVAAQGEHAELERW